MYSKVCVGYTKNVATSPTQRLREFVSVSLVFFILIGCIGRLSTFSSSLFNKVNFNLENWQKKTGLKKKEKKGKDVTLVKWTLPVLFHSILVQQQPLFFSFFYTLILPLVFLKWIHFINGHPISYYIFPFPFIESVCLKFCILILKWKK